MKHYSDLFNMRKLIISIIGSGALGKTYGGILALGGHDVHFLMKSEYEKICEAQGFELNFLKLEKKVQVHPKIYLEANKLPPSDLVIIALKTTQNSQIRELLSSCLQKNTVLLVMQNGIGNEEYFSSIFPENPIIAGVSTFGVTREDPLHTKIHNIGELRLAPFKLDYSQHCEEIYAQFQNAVDKNFLKHFVKIFKNHREIRWRKLLWNTVFGPLSIIHDKPVNRLVTDYKEKVIELMFEIKKIAFCDGVNIEDNYIHKVIEETLLQLNYYPSMYVDYKNGKAIEKEYLLNNVLKASNQHNIVSSELCNMEKQLSNLYKEKRE